MASSCCTSLLRKVDEARGRRRGRARARRCVVVARWMRQEEVYLSSSVSGSRPQIITKIIALPKSRR